MRIAATSSTLEQPLGQCLVQRLYVSGEPTLEFDSEPLPDYKITLCNELQNLFD